VRSHGARAQELPDHDPRALPHPHELREDPGTRESRTIPFSCLVDTSDEPTVDPERFLDGSHRWAGHWASAPERFDALPPERLLAGETRRLVAETIATLPPAQRTVLSLRDVEGWDAAEVSECMGLSEANQRVLLHRARARVRRALEAYFSAPSQA
jgi:RNA polymerase sigma-70 factor (ECF subfamily)